MTNNGTIHANEINFIEDNSNNIHKLLIHCSIDELKQELPYRQENLKLEQIRKIRASLPFLAACAVFFAIGILISYITKDTSALSALSILASLVSGALSCNIAIQPTKFELSEKSAINQIVLLLKQRRAI